MRRASVSLVSFAFLGLLVLSITYWKALPETTNDDVSYLPKAGEVNLLALGHQETVAGLFWISAVIHYGDALLRGSEYAYMNHTADITTTLDSLFYMAYIFTGALSNKQDADSLAIITVLKRGNQVFPRDWRLALYYSHYLADINHFDDASRVMKVFSTTDTVPEFVRHIFHSYELRKFPIVESIGLMLDDYLNPVYIQFREGIYLQMLMRLNISEISERVYLHNLLLNCANQKSSPAETYQTIIQRWVPQGTF